MSLFKSLFKSSQKFTAKKVIPESEKLITVDAYTPDFLSSQLGGMNFVGRTLDDILFPNGISESKPHYIEIYGSVILALDDGRKIGFEVLAESHFSVTVYEANTEIPNENPLPTETDANLSRLKGIVGQKIIACEVDSGPEIYHNGAYCDKGYDENQSSFIYGIRFTFADQSTLYITVNDACYIVLLVE